MLINIQTTDKELKDIFKSFKTDFSLIIQKQDKIMSDFSKLQAEVSEIKSINQSAITLIKGIAERLKEAKGDQEKIDALTAELDSEGTALADAVVANTPAKEEEKTPPTDEKGGDEVAA